MKKLSSFAEQLTERYQDWYRSFHPKEAETVHVDKEGTASFYEKNKGNLTSQQKHLFRKKLIFEILKGKLIINEENEIAEFLVKELIRRGRLNNDSVPQAKIKQVQEIINKYVFIMGHTSEGKKGRSKNHLQQWLLHITAWEIEDALRPHKKRILIDQMSKLAAKRTEVEDLSEEEKETQAFIASYQTLLDSTKTRLTYYLLLKKLPQWQDPSQEQLVKLTTDIYSFWEEIREELKSPFQKKFKRTCKKLIPVFLLLEEILEKNNDSENFKKPEWLEKKIKETYQNTLQKIKKNTFRMTMFSTAALLLLKLILFLTVEVPYLNFPLTFNAVTVNLFGPAFLMLFLGLNISAPQERNFNLISLETMKIVYGQETTEDESGSSNRALFFLFYLFTFLLFSGLIFIGLSQLNFPLLSQVIFLFFIFLTSSFLKRIQKKVERIKVTERESLSQDIFKTFSAPLELFTFKSNSLLVAYLTAALKD